MSGEPVRGRDYWQAVKPPHWHLEETCVLPSGRHLNGAKARVYQVLKLARDTSHCFPIGRHLAPAGWVPTWVIREPWAGGSAGDRRLRDLKVIGVPVEGKPFEGAGEDGAAAESWVWRLGEGVADGSNARNNPPGASARVSPRGVLTSLTFRVGVEGSKGEVVDVSPGRGHVCAPRAALAARVLRGGLSAEQAAAEYRQQLLEAYRSGELVKALGGGLPREVTFRSDAVPFDSLGVLTAALRALGATGGEA